MDYRDAKKESGSANSLGILLKMQRATHGWKYKEQFGKTNDPGRMHGACDSVAGENIIFATVTRKTGDTSGACNDAVATVITGDDRKNRIVSLLDI